MNKSIKLIIIFSMFILGFSAGFLLSKDLHARDAHEYVKEIVDIYCPRGFYERNEPSLLNYSFNLTEARLKWEKTLEK